MDKQIVKGNSLDLFTFFNNSLTRVAHSRNLSLEISNEYSEVKSKDDDGNFYGKRLISSTWSLEGESLVCDDEYHLQIIDMIIKGSKVVVSISYLEDPESADLPEYGYIGEAVIEDLELISNTGDIATYSYVLKGSGPLEYMRIGDVKPPQKVNYFNKEDISIYFPVPGSTQEENAGNIFDIPDVVNDKKVPLRFTVQQINED